VTEADLLLHVVDASDSDPDRQIAAVRSVLDEIDAADIPEILVFNKTDITARAVVGRLVATHPGSVAISALTGTGFDDLGAAIVSRLDARTVELDLLVPYDRGDVVAALHRDGDIVKESHVDEGTAIVVRIPVASAGTYGSFTAGL